MDIDKLYFTYLQRPRRFVHVVLHDDDGDVDVLSTSVCVCVVCDDGRQCASRDYYHDRYDMQNYLQIRHYPALLRSRVLAELYRSSSFR